MIVFNIRKIMFDSINLEILVKNQQTEIDGLTREQAISKTENAIYHTLWNMFRKNPDLMKIMNEGKLIDISAKTISEEEKKDPRLKGFELNINVDLAWDYDTETDFDEVVGTDGKNVQELLNSCYILDGTEFGCLETTIGKFKNLKKKDDERRDIGEDKPTRVTFGLGG